MIPVKRMWGGSEYEPLKVLVEQMNLLKAVLLNVVTTKAGLAIGDPTKTVVENANAIQYRIGGVAYTKAADTTFAFTATVDDIAASATTVQERVYLWCLNAAGDVSHVTSDQATGAGNAEVPATPEGVVAVGYTRIAVAAGATSFDATTDELDEAHLTDTYVDLQLNAIDEVFEQLLVLE
jgi:hypothetical protein